MNIKFNLALLTITTAFLTPLQTFGDSGVGGVVQGVGKGVEDLGSGIGNAVEDVGHGIGNAFSDHGHSSASDAAITTRVQDRIKSLADDNKIAAGYDLNVQTINGEVTITGVVADSDDIATLRNEVNKVRGVQSVSTNITVKNQ